MSYIDKILANSERVVYRTHRHIVVLLGRLLGSAFAFLVFLGVGLAVLIPKTSEAGNEIRFVVGVITLGTLVMPLYLIVSAWLEGLRGRELVRRTWQAALVGLALLVVALILMLIPDSKLIGWLAIAIALVPAAELVRIFLDWLFERYIITNRRVMQVSGIINKRVTDSALEKVNDVELTQSIVGRLLGYGTISIITGSDIGVNRFRRISNPVRFKREMLNAKESLHGEDAAEEEKVPPSGPPDGAVDAAAPVSVSGAAADIPDLIAELDELRQQGILSEEEFQAKKKELLDRL